MTRKEIQTQVNAVIQTGVSIAGISTVSLILVLSMKIRDF